MKEQLEKLVLHMYRGGIPYPDAVREFQKAFVLTVLREQKANQLRAALKLGMHRNTLRRILRDLGVDTKLLRVGRRRPPLSERLVERKARAN